MSLASPAHLDALWITAGLTYEGDTISVTAATPPKKVSLVGCEPEHVPTDELSFGLSQPVENALSDAVELVWTLAEEMSREVSHA